MTTKKLTPAELEQIRQDAITNNLKESLKGYEEVGEKIDFLIRLLQANKDHVGGFVCVLAAKEGSTMVDIDDHTTGEMFSCRVAAHNGYIHPLTATLRSLLGWFKEANAPNPMDFLSAMMREKE